MKYKVTTFVRKYEKIHFIYFKNFRHIVSVNIIRGGTKMRFIKRTNANSISELVEKNTGMKADEFLNVNEKPYIYGLTEAVKFFKKNASKQVFVIGDYDSDGINATAIMYLGLKKFGIEAKMRLPKRFSEGYGLSEKIVKETEEFLKIIDEIENGLIITVDNGIAAHAAIKRAKDKGISVIITDHHMGGLVLPEADVIVDPNAEDGHVPKRFQSEFKNYCGAALAYRFIEELLPEGTDLTDLLILASIATVTDIMDLVGANRFLVKKGLELVNKGYGPKGLRLIIEKLKLSEHICEEDFGFSIGPVFNASSRLYDEGASLVLNVLTKDDIREEDVDILIKNNEERKQITKKSLAICEMFVKERPIVVYEPSLGEGIIGLVAGKFCEKYACPTIVFTDTEEDGMIKGSARSPEGIHLKQILDKVAEFGLIEKYGGHAGAAGLTIKKSKLEEFRIAFRREVGKLPELTDDVFYDIEVPFGMVSAYMEDLERFAPYGKGNPRPVFRIKVDVPDGGYHVIGKNKDSFLINARVIKLLGFGMVPLYDYLGKPTFLDCIGSLSLSWFRGRSTNQLNIKAMMS